MTAEIVAMHYRRLYKEYNLEKCEIVEVTDGGNNLKKAAKLFNHKRLHCSNHVLNLIINEGLLPIANLI